MRQKGTRTLMLAGPTHPAAASLQAGCSLRLKHPETALRSRAIPSGAANCQMEIAPAANGFLVRSCCFEAVQYSVQGVVTPSRWLMARLCLRRRPPPPAPPCCCCPAPALAARASQLYTTPTTRNCR